MTTIHAYTGDQALHDGDHKDFGERNPLQITNSHHQRKNN